MRIDLHCHSTASDGEYAPAEVVRRAHAAGLGVLALTDHDTLAGLPEALVEGDRVGRDLLAGGDSADPDALLGDRHVDGPLLGLVVRRGRGDDGIGLAVGERLAAIGVGEQPPVASGRSSDSPSSS